MSCDCGRYGPGRVPASGIKSYTDGGPPGRTRRRALQRGRVRPRPDPADAGLRHGGLRRHPVQEPAGRRFDIQLNKTSRNSILVQTNINNTRSDVAHLPSKCSPISPRRSSSASPSGGERSAGGICRAGEIADDRRTRPAQLQPLPRLLSATNPRADARGPYAAAVLHGLRRRRLRIHQADEPGDRRAAQERPGAGVGELRDSVSARLPDHGARPGHHRRYHHLHAQARRERDPRLRRRPWLEAAQPCGAGGKRKGRKRQRRSREGTAERSSQTRRDVADGLEAVQRDGADHV